MSFSGEVFLARQPILDRRHRVTAYEVLYRDSAHATEARIADPSGAASRVLANVFSSLDAGAVLGSLPGFFNVNEAILRSRVVESLPHDRVVLEVLESVEPSDALTSRCKQLRQRGFELALDDFVADDPRESLVDLVRYVKIDLRAVGRRELPRLVERLRGRSVVLLAEKVESREEFERCCDLGFELFQGFFFAHPSRVQGRPVDPPKAAVLELLRAVDQGAGEEELQRGFERHPALGPALLRLLNGVEFRRQPLRTLRHAVAQLGRRRLKRWLALLLFAVSETPGASPLLLQTAAMRGRLVELLDRTRRGGECDPEARAFLAGALSLSDALLEAPLAEVVDSLRLDGETASGLLDRSGELGALVSLAEAVERAEFPVVSQQLASLGIGPDVFSQAELGAFRWSSAVEQALTG